MSSSTNDQLTAVNHVFVDYENVRDIDPTVIGAKNVHLTLLLGAQKAKFDGAIVEKLIQHAGTVEMIRLTSPGRNALDFALAYYLGRAVLADPHGYFHLVSKDKGYDALIKHLRGKHIRVQRHDDFSALTFSAPKPVAAVVSAATAAKHPTPAAKPTPKHPVPTAKPEPKPETELEKLERKVLEHLRKPTTKRPGTHKKLVGYLVAHLGKKHTEAEIGKLITMLSQAGHLVTDDKGKVTYHLAS